MNAPKTNMETNPNSPIIRRNVAMAYSHPSQDPAIQEIVRKNAPGSEKNSNGSKKPRSARAPRLLAVRSTSRRRKILANFYLEGADALETCPLQEGLLEKEQHMNVI